MKSAIYTKNNKNKKISEYMQNVLRLKKIN